MAKNKDVVETNHPNNMCGLIMPISETEGYPRGHWAAIKSILDEVIIDAGYIPNLVSDADDVGIIHNRIVKNLAENSIVVCDVSSKNPNVMFELGLRLAFDKATIIIKDELTSYNFDTSPIEHLGYPSDLNYHAINDFKEKLKSKLLSTVEAAKDPEYSTFLKNFVIYKRQVQTQELDNIDYITKQFDLLNRKLERLEISGSKKNQLSPNKSTRLSSEYVADLFRMFLEDTKISFDEYQNMSTGKARILLSRFLKRMPVTDNFSEELLISIAEDMVQASIEGTLDDALAKIETGSWIYRVE